MPRIVQVDAFTDVPFRGNPAAVCVLPGEAPEAWMREVAREMNLSETAFLHVEGDAYRLRWFTPAVEVDLCGHATLASAHVLWEDGHLDDASTAVFETRIGRLTADRRDGRIEMDFPAAPPETVAAPPGLEDAVGGPPRWVGRNRFDLLVELESESDVRRLVPDPGRVLALGARGLIVTARPDAGSAGGYDFVSRFFAPAVGVPEDPVTGSAHCCLAPYWAARLGRTELTGYQASARGGEVRVRLAGDRVVLGGRAVTVLRGELLPGW